MVLLLLAALLAQDQEIARHAAAASAAMQAGDYAGAERHNRAIVRLAPDLAEARSNLGLSCFLQKKYKDAVQAFESGLDRKPDMANAWLFLGLSQFHLNRLSLAAPPLRRYVEMRPDDFQGRYFLGLCLLGLERYRDAEHSLREALNLDRASIDALYHLAQSLAGQARREPSRSETLWPAYEAAVREIAAIDPDSYRIGQLKAGYYEASGEKKKAIEELERLLARGAAARGLHYSLGCLYTESGLYEKALGEFQAELRLDSPDPRTHLQLGHVYLALRKPAEAQSALERALEMEPESGGLIWVEVGRAHMMQEEPLQAVEAFEKAIGAGRRTSSVYYQLAMAYRKAGRPEKYREVLAISERMRDAEKPSR
jgi:tetratricopeptide (TPR) repeat protein